MKELLGLITIVLAIAGNSSYIISIFKKITKPHLFTWLVWSISTAAIFVAQYLSGAGPGSWSTASTGIFTIVITILSFKYGTKDISFSDKIYFLISIFVILLWIVIKNPLLSVIILTVVDFFAFFPTIRKTINDPHSETISIYLLSIIRHGISIIATLNYSLIILLFPSMLLVMNSVMLVIILYFRFKKRF